MSSTYVGRFAPSPTGPLHAGSLVAALASWLDARAHGGRWLVRLEDVDLLRCIPGADQLILQQLAQCGLVSDEPVVWQSHRHALYQAALDQLVAQHQAYPCACTRANIAQAHERAGRPKARHAELVYPGTCRPDRGGLDQRPARAWRVAVPPAGSPPWAWQDRWLGHQQQDLAEHVGDFVLRRADGLWAYQLAVVVDDADQGITHVVRGQDLADNTPRQQWLQHCLGLPTPNYLHTPLVLGPNGEKLSKQNGAQPLDTSQPMSALRAAASVLGLPDIVSPTVGEWLALACVEWATARKSVNLSAKL